MLGNNDKLVLKSFVSIAKNNVFAILPKKFMQYISFSFLESFRIFIIVIELIGVQFGLTSYV